MKAERLEQQVKDLSKQVHHAEDGHHQELRPEVTLSCVFCRSLQSCQAAFTGVLPCATCTQLFQSAADCICCSWSSNHFWSSTFLTHAACNEHCCWRPRGRLIRDRGSQQSDKKIPAHTLCLLPNVSASLQAAGSHIQDL